MKAFIQTIHNSYKFLRIISDTSLINALEAEVKKRNDTVNFKKGGIFEYQPDKFYFHRHFIVEVLN